jgi:hypothetical protein
VEAYVYQAGFLCEKCGEKIREELKAKGKAPANPEDEGTYDSDVYPKGPFTPDESDTPQHCDKCSKFLENPLTEDGYNYVLDTMWSAQKDFGGQFTNPVVRQWYEYYKDDTFGDDVKSIRDHLEEDE